jgi:hypothetical protein
MNITTHEDQIRKWRDIIHEAKESGMTTIDWCTQNGIPKGQFYYWHKKVKDYALLHESTTAVPQNNITLSPKPKELDLAVFCEVPISKPASPLPFNEQYTADLSYAPEIVLQYDMYKLLIGSNITQKTLATVLSVISHV